MIAAIGVLIMNTGNAQIKIDRSKKPAASPAPSVSIKDPVIFNLPNGITVLVVENHKLPKVRATFSIDAGPIREGSKAGLMDIMGQMLGEGTKTMTKAQFDEAVDMIGAEVSLSASGGYAGALTRYFEKAFMLMTDGLKNPSFPKESFDKIVSQTLTGLKATEKSAPAIAGRVYDALSYGKNTAQGEFVTEQTVKSLTLEDVKTAYKNYITPSRSYLTFIGDITPAAARALATKAFGGWSGKKLEEPSAGNAINPYKTEIDFVDLPTAVQGELSVGNLVNNPLGGKDYHALILANQILGGGADSKLFMNLREKHGFTYGAYSSVGSGRFQSLFKAGAAVRTEKVDSAVNEMLREILNMRDGKITAEELAIAKAKYNGSFALRMENPATTANYASDILINKLPKDFYKTFLQKINKVTIEDIKRVSKNYFNETGSRILIVGNGKKILPNLARLGLPIKKYDKYADPVIEKNEETDVKESPKTTDDISAFSIVENYLSAIGGKEEVKKINTIAADASMAFGARTFTGRYLQMNPNKNMLELKMGAITVLKSVFDGTKGYLQQGPSKNELNAEEIQEQLDDRGVIPQLHYITPEFKAEYLGSGSFNNENTYRLKVTLPSGRTTVQQYSAKSGLLLQEETTSKQNGADVPVTVEYKNYQKFGAVMYYTEITRNFGGTELTMNLSNIKFNEGVKDEDFK